LVTTLVLASMFTYSFGAAVAGTADEASALLEIDDTTYRFSPTTCAVADNDFVASGTGTLNGDSFWVSASSDRVSLALGAEHRIEEPEPDQLWLTSVDHIRWHNTDGDVVGSVTLRDERNPESDDFVGRLSISCPAF
jgi:hypothetical protein